jgi:hypothetical protein
MAHLKEATGKEEVNEPEITLILELRTMSMTLEKVAVAFRPKPPLKFTECKVCQETHYGHT